MSEGSCSVASARPTRRVRGWFSKVAVGGLVATAGLLAMAGVSSAYPLIGS
jgi:hypothetical protein